MELGQQLRPLDKLLVELGIPHTLANTDGQREKRLVIPNPPV